MVSIYNTVFANTTLESIINSSQVKSALLQLETSKNVYFDIPLNNTIKNELTSVLGINLEGYTTIPMRWIIGDTPAHIDRQHDNSEFKNTYLIYLSDSLGSLVVDNVEFPIKKNTAYVFSEGLDHKTTGTENIPRLLVGPMSENIVAVGAPVSPTFISQPGGTTVYIQQNGSDVEYSIDQNSWQTIVWPCNVSNSSTDIYKGFRFTGLGTRDLLTKLENYVVATNTNNLANLKIYKSQSFDNLYPNLFVETANPDFTERTDDHSDIQVSSIGTGSGVVVVNGQELPIFSSNGYIGEWNYGIQFPSADFDFDSPGDPDACMNVWRDSNRFHIRLYRVELYQDGTNAEVTIDMVYKFNTNDVYIKVSNLLNFSNESNNFTNFGIYSQSHNPIYDPNVLSIDISTIDFNSIDGLPFYHAIGLSGEVLRTAGFTDNDLITAGYTLDSSNVPIFDFLKINFISDITLYNTYSYFICNSSRIQFGSNQLKNNGSRPVITIDGVQSDYPGLIQNGSPTANGYSHINIYNLVVNSINGSQLSEAGGWIGQKHFGKNSTINYIINCSSDGDINNGAGGIVGQYASYPSGLLTLIGCSSSGQIYGTYAGGIVGVYAGDTITCRSCWSSGVISGNSAGGIISGFSYNQNCLVENSYSEGLISGNNAGGIFGSSAKGQAVNCYSRGNITGTSSGGIFGIPIEVSAQAINCYSTGTIGQFAGGIIGPSGSPSQTTNCYTCGVTYNNDGVGAILGNDPTIPNTCGHSGGSWSDAMANTVLTGIPSSYPLGITWYSIGQDVPYNLKNMGYSPYNLTNIANNNLVRASNLTINQGGLSNTGNYFNNYSILKITGGNNGSYNTISINNSTGIISTTSQTVAGTYTIYVYSEGSYNLTEYTLVINQIPCLTEDTMVLTPGGYINVTCLRNGDYITTSDNRDVKINYIYSTVVKNPLDTNLPCIVKKDSIAPNYPSKDFCISQNHLIYYNNCWILPRLFYQLDNNRDMIKYYHIKLDNYKTDHLVINDGVVVESLASTIDECNEYFNRVQLSIKLYNILSGKANNHYDRSGTVENSLECVNSR